MRKPEQKVLTDSSAKSSTIRRKYTKDCIIKYSRLKFNKPADDDVFLKVPEDEDELNRTMIWLTRFAQYREWELDKFKEHYPMMENGPLFSKDELRERKRYKELTRFMSKKITEIRNYMDTNIF